MDINDFKSWFKEYPILAIGGIIFGLILINSFIFLIIGQNNYQNSISGFTIKENLDNQLNANKPLNNPTQTTNLTDTSQNTEDLTNYEYIKQSNLYKVSRIVDGDTIEVSTGEKVRLICIDTPEVGEDYYGEAKDRLSELILNQNVELVKDKSETDRYGRLLRYIYLNGNFINAQIVKEGYARTYPYSPDTSKCPEIESAETYAKNNNLGLWQVLYEDDTTDSTQTSTSTEVCKCDSNMYNCDDFQTHSEAQACYNYCISLGKGDIHLLDKDKDGLACER